jgi:hypothetical protein
MEAGYPDVRAAICRTFTPIEDIASSNIPQRAEAGAEQVRGSPTVVRGDRPAGGVLCAGELGLQHRLRLLNDRDGVPGAQVPSRHLRRYSVHAMSEHSSDFGGSRAEYVNDGFRSILHDTELQDFLERTFRFEKAHAGVDAYCRQPSCTLVRAAFPSRTLAPRVDERARAAHELERAVRAARLRA